MSALSCLSPQARKRRVLPLITDGKRDDPDQHKGRRGVEDSHNPAQEVRRMGNAVLGIPVDRDGKS